MLDGTGWEQDTFEIIRATEKSQWQGAYSPYHLSTWEYAPEQSGFDARNMILHEISHAIEVFERKRPSRLLSKNYGFQFGHFTRRCFDTEIWVLGLQRFLCEELFQVNSMTDDVITRVRNSFSVKVDVPKEEFIELLEKSYQYHRERGIAHYHAQWRLVCDYVKTHRPPKEHDILKELLGISLG